MKHILLFIALFIGLQSVSAQSHQSTEGDFRELQRRFDGLGNRGYSLRLLDHMNNFHLTSHEAKLLAARLRTDKEKGDFLYQVFPQILDPENYIEVVDVFRHFSSALKLYHYTIGSYAKIQHYEDVPNTYPPQYHYTPEVIYEEPICDMPDGVFQKFITTLENASFSDTKMNIVKSHVNKTCFDTDQIAKIMNEFSSDQDRVDVATHLYGNCLDPENYFTLLDVLTFSDSKDQLNQYISTH